MNGILPYKIEYSWGDQKCAKCHRKIRIDHIQIAIMKQSDEDDCYNPEWFHMKCFFQTRRPSTEAGFDGFALLRYADQLAIREELGIIDRGCLQSPDTEVSDFSIEYAKHNRDTCSECDQNISKGAVRIMKIVKDINQNTTFDGKATWYHIECFVRKRCEHGWLESAEKLPGFRHLNDTDKETVKRQISIANHFVDNSLAIPSSIDLKQLEEQIKTQNEQYYEVYDELSQLSKAEQVDLLKKSGHLVPNTDYEICHHLTDLIVFGAIDKCDKCRTHSYVFRNTKYVCAHEMDWGKCGHTVAEPPRRKFRMHPGMLEKYPFLKQPESVQARALHRFQWTDEEGNDLVFGVYKHPKLFNMTFVIVGELSKTKEEVEDIIWKLGGKLVEKISKKLTAVISNQNEVKKMGTLMKQAKRYNIQVVSEEFLTAIEATEDPFLYIISQSLCEWGGDPYARTEQKDVKSRRETDFYTKSLPEKLSYKWKDGSAVDPECGLADNAHVYCGDARTHKNVSYSVVLGLVDIENNKNSYYRMQLLESDELKLYWVFEAYGRISTSIGSKKLKTYGTLEEALAHFNATYEQKTGYPFGKNMKKSTKYPNKFYHLDIEFCAKKELPTTFVETKLDKPVYELMQMLFDVKRMEDMMFGFDLDLKQMPLGKISGKQIQLAMEVLGRISWLIEHNGSAGDLQAASNKFYTLIPHAFSVKRPPIIDTIEIVNEKNEMLESLLNMELIYGFLDEEYGEKSNPLDACYLKLKNEIVSVDKNSWEYKKLCSIVQLTHGPTHKHYTLEVLEVFKLKREGEDERFQVYEQLDRHRLLWHGSRLMNFVSILTNGLKIAPPEAPGYMFNKGIYFADIVSKSANYCYTDPHNNIGLMLMCEVALGKSRKLVEATAVEGIPNENEQSVKAIGAFFPSVKINIDNVAVNLGHIRRGTIPTKLWYNEFIVYDPAQVKVKYLFKMKFNYKPIAPQPQ